MLTVIIWFLVFFFVFFLTFKTDCLVNFSEPSSIKLLSYVVNIDYFSYFILISVASCIAFFFIYYNKLKTQYFFLLKFWKK